MTQTRRWVLGTGLAVVLLLAAGWFLLVAPQRSEAAALAEQAQAQRDANDQLQLKIQQLTAQAADLAAEEERLAELRVKVPETPELPPLVRLLTAAAAASGADLRALAPGEPTLLVDPAAAPVAPPADSGGTAAAAGPAAAPAAGAAPAQAAAPGAVSAPAAASAATGSLHFLPLTVTTQGTYSQLVAFLDAVEELDRSLLVTGLTLSSERDDQTGGVGVTATIQTRAFVSPPAPGVATPVPTAPVPAETPVPTPGTAAQAQPPAATSPSQETP
jgi:Tfp pilus assembly protein PilO